MHAGLRVLFCMNELPIRCNESLANSAGSTARRITVERSVDNLEKPDQACRAAVVGMHTNIQGFNT
jgi:hypothetical protein